MSATIITPEYWHEAQAHLRARDPVLATLIDAYAGESLTSRGSAFYSLIRAVVGQQISVRAADAIWSRVEALLGARVEPEAVLALAPEALRAAGLSGQKIRYLYEVARFFAQHPSYPWHSQEEEQLLLDLVSIKGIGRWSAEMFLIFHLLRPDVLPLGDIGLQKAIERHYNAGEKLPRAAMEALGERWRPYRTVATWYLWRSLDPVPVAY